MERCPCCGECTAFRNLYTGKLTCYRRGCGYSEEGRGGLVRASRWAVRFTAQYEPNAATTGGR